MIASPDNTNPPPSKDELTREMTGQQMPLLPFALIGHSVLYASGGCAANPMNFPGYGGLYGRTYQTYRWMLNHPILRLVRAISNGPLLASYWQYKGCDDSIPAERVDFIGKVFNRIRQRALQDILRGRDYGWAGFEPIWEVRGNEVWLDELKPLTQEYTGLLVNDAGRFVGLSALMRAGEAGAVVNTSTTSVNGLSAPYKAWIYTYDRECGNLYGRSWLENVRDTAWKDWLDTAQQLQKLSGSISGMQVIVSCPDSMRDSVNAGLTAMKNGAAGMVIPSLLANIKPGDSINATDLAKLAATGIVDWEMLDFGTRTQAIQGLLARMAHDEELMFAGGLRPSRTGLEGKHGTKAEAGTHTDTGMLVSELDDDDIAEQLQPLIDAVGSLNWADYKPGDVYIDPPPLVDSKSAFQSALLTAISANPAVSGGIANMVVEPTLEALDIDVKPGVKFELVQPVAPTPSKSDPAQPGDPPPTKGQKRMGQLRKRFAKAVA